VVWRRTAAKRLRATLLAIKQELRRRMHEPIVVVGAWLKRVVKVTIDTMPFRATWLCPGVSENGSAATGDAFCVVAVSGANPTGNN
jgi:hypothetical protein